MKGKRCSPFYLQSIILSFGGFYLLGLATTFATSAFTNCTNNDEGEKTNNEYDILCIGNSITSIVFGITSIITLSGAIAGLMQKDIDIITSFVLLGVLSGYTSDAFTNLKLNCTAGSTVDINSFDDDSWDSASKLCHSFIGSSIGGMFGLLGATISAYYGILMKLHGKFYPARPVGILIGMAGYCLIFCFKSVGASWNSCHYYDGAKDSLEIKNNITSEFYDKQSDLIDNTFGAQCDGFYISSIILGIDSSLPILGIYLLFKLQKKGLWFNFCIFTTLVAAANSQINNGLKTTSCYIYDHPPPKESPYTYDEARVQCSTYTSAYNAGIAGSCLSGIAVMICIYDIISNLDHDTFLIRFRRCCMFGFGFCYMIATAMLGIGKMTPDCDLFNDSLDDTVEHDDGVLSNNCKGNSTAVFFYFLSAFSASIGIVCSFRYNFPQDGAALSEVKILKSKSLKTDQIIDNLDNKYRELQKETPLASSLFRFNSYHYHPDIKDILLSNSLDEPLLV